MTTIAASDGPLHVHLAETGDGPPLLLLHGWPQHHEIWHDVASRLEGFRLLMPDLGGFGSSEAHADDWRLRLLDGCGHWTPQERPDAVVEAARELFSPAAGR